MNSNNNEIRKRRNSFDNIVQDDDVQYINRTGTTTTNKNVTDFFSHIKWDEIIAKKRKEFLNQIEHDIDEIFDQLKDDLIATEDDSDRIKASIDESSSKYRSPKKSIENSLPEKVFQTRDSVLTSLLQISHIRTVYHIFVAILIIFSVNTMLTDWLEKGGIIHIYHLESVFWAFGNFSDVIWIWLSMQALTIIIYPCFISWLYGTMYFVNYRSLINRLYLFVYVLFQLFFIVIPLGLILSLRLPPCSTTIIVMENIRLMMKIHSFIRENVAKEFRSGQLLLTIHFSRYLYFLFAPTLIYRDSYPKNPTVRWSYVVSNFSQVLFCIIYMYYIFSRFCVTYFQNFNSTHVTVEQLVLSIFGCMLPGALVLFICFFCLLHSWLNAFAEMLQFGDRLFYKEWWNSTTFSNYYRTWNVVVHDWLYTYIYRDLLLLGGCPNRSVATIIVFLCSAVFHEYVLIVTFRFFYPVLFVLFSGVGLGMMFIKGRSRFWNIGFWVAMFSGTGILLCLYSMEWYARRNCPIYFNQFVDLLVPRSWFCQS